MNTLKKICDIPIDGLQITVGMLPLKSLTICSPRPLVNTYVLGKSPIILGYY